MPCGIAYVNAEGLADTLHVISYVEEEHIADVILVRKDASI